MFKGSNCVGISFQDILILCLLFVIESDMVNNTFAMTTAANTTLPLTNSHLIADSLVLPLQTIQTSDIRVSAPLYKTLPGRY